MTDSASNKANPPEGFDKPTGPFARKVNIEDANAPQDTPYAEHGEDYISFADETEAAPQAAPAAKADDATAELVQAMTKLQQENETLRDQALRALAEVENTRRRAQREREDAMKYSVSSFAKDLLDVADTFRRALDSIPEELKEGDARVVALIEGIQATERNMLDALGKNGITRLDPLDELFNPNFHDVMFEAVVPGKAAGTVIQVIDPGYMLNDRLLRPARVGVVKADSGNDSKHVLDESI